MVMLIWSNLYANCLHFWVVLNRLSRELSNAAVIGAARTSASATSADT
jgi:hypothetical protein